MATNELKIVIRLLKSAAKKFNELDSEAHFALRMKQDVTTHRKKLLEKAQLLLNLENEIIIPLSVMKGAELDISYEIKEQVASFAFSARDAIKKNNLFALGTLLTSMGSKEGEGNYLEKLIEDLEKK